MNDIIVFSFDTKKHLNHLNKVLNFLEKSEIILTLRKCHFAYLNIKTLDHYVFRLKMSTLKKNQNHKKTEIF